MANTLIWPSHTKRPSMMSNRDIVEQHQRPVMSTNIIALTSLKIRKRLKITFEQFWPHSHSVVHNNGVNAHSPHYLFCVFHD